SPVDRAQHRIEIVAAAHDQVGRADHAESALAARQLWMLFDAVERHFGTAPKYRKHGAVFQKINRVIAPLTGCNFSPIKIENAPELAAAESHLVGGGGGRTERGRGPQGLAWINFAGNKRHAAPPGWV